MSKNVKVLLIIGGILVFLGVVCVGGIAFFGYYFIDMEGIEKASKEGKEYGRTTDNLGCQTKIVGMIKPLKETDLNGILRTQSYFDGCLEASRETPNFCDGVANPFTDKLKDDAGKEAECNKLGFEDSNACRQVIDKKLDFCFMKKK